MCVPFGMIRISRVLILLLVMMPGIVKLSILVIHLRKVMRLVRSTVPCNGLSPPAQPYTRAHWEVIFCVHNTALVYRTREKYYVRSVWDDWYD
jgi:hypothetical protein